MHLTSGFSRREFLAHTSCFGAFYALALRIPLPALAADLAGDSRVSQTPLVDKGFAAVRKVGNGLYATISDPSKGPTTLCNGGFLVGKEAALLIEGFTTPAGAQPPLYVTQPAATGSSPIPTASRPTPLATSTSRTPATVASRSSPAMAFSSPSGTRRAVPVSLFPTEWRPTPPTTCSWLTTPTAES